MKFKTLILFCCIAITGLSAQTGVKVEREFGMNASDVPQAARDFVSACEFPRKVRWYQEQTAADTSYEAKTRKEGRRYSLEFTRAGEIEDVEFETRLEQIPAETRKKIHDTLCQSFEKYTIVKIQQQWSGPVEILIDKIRGAPVALEPLTRYEIVLKGAREDGRQLYEFLLGQNGQLISKSVLRPASTHHLDH